MKLITHEHKNTKIKPELKKSPNKNEIDYTRRFNVVVEYCIIVLLKSRHYPRIKRGQYRKIQTGD